MLYAMQARPSRVAAARGDRFASGVPHRRAGAEQEGAGDRRVRAVRLGLRRSGTLDAPTVRDALLPALVEWEPSRSKWRSTCSRSDEHQPRVSRQGVGWYRTGLMMFSRTATGNDRGDDCQLQEDRADEGSRRRYDLIVVAGVDLSSDTHTCRTSLCSTTDEVVDYNREAFEHELAEYDFALDCTGEVRAASVLVAFVGVECLTWMLSCVICRPSSASSA